jgi:pyruvate formate lyase activating enzyme
MGRDGALTGSVLRIERSSIHDGPGLRTVVFLKGCPLRCSWCSTPESQDPLPERGYLSDFCTLCGTCVDVCPPGALRLSEDRSSILRDVAKCGLCFTCVDACPGGAIKRYGTFMTVEETVREIVKDEVFFFHSGGGVTLSGGEPLTQAKFVVRLLRECRERGIHTAMETSFHVPFDCIEGVLPLLDLLYVDIKHMDGECHRQWIGQENALILENIRKADAFEAAVEMVFRIPLIPHLNDSDSNLGAVADFCRSMTKLKEVELLPYHRLGSHVYGALGREYALMALAPPSRERILERAHYLARQAPGVPVRVGGGFC